jgi:hypothetical protein
MNGKDWRKLLAQHELILLPSLPKEKADLVKPVLRTLAEIGWICYAPCRVQKYRGVRLRLHALCYNLNDQFVAAFGIPTSGGSLLYLHTIVSHFAPWYELFDFRNASTEPGEAFFAQLKKKMLYYTNRHMDDALLETIIRLHQEHELHLKLKKKGTDSASVVYKILTLQYLQLAIDQVYIPKIRVDRD